MCINHFAKDGVEYFQLYIQCPVCIEHGWPTKKYHWTHGDYCGGDIYVGDNAFYYCKKCGYTAPIMEWGYICPNHEINSVGHTISVYEGKHLINPLSVVADCSTENGLRWFVRFIAALDEYLDKQSL